MSVNASTHCSSHSQFLRKLSQVLRMRVGSLGFVLLAWLVGCCAGCDLFSAAQSRPDLTGTWDITYDDYLEIEIEVDGEVFHRRLSVAGGSVLAHHAGADIRATIACERAEVLCPTELWPRHLTLSNRIGQVDGQRFSIWLQGEGEGACRLGPSSLVSAELETLGEPGTRYEATMLTSGKIVTELSAACLRATGAAAIPEAARVRVSAGFSGVRRASIASADKASVS